MTTFLSDLFPKGTGRGQQPARQVQVPILPSRLPKKAKPSTRWRSQAHCNYLRGFRCSIPGCHGMPIEVAHVRLGSGAGVGQKPSDWRAVPLCRNHHAQQHAIGEATFWNSYRAASGSTVEELIDALCRDSPKRAAIADERAGK